MQVGDLVKLLGDDIRGTAHPDTAIVPAGTMGIVVRCVETYRPHIALFGVGGVRPFMNYDLEVISESR
jgi:hypothetical protein